MLQSLNYLGYDGFGGIPLIDAVVRPETSTTTNLTNIDTYLQFLTIPQIQVFFNFAANVSYKSRSEIRDQFSAFPYFSDNYISSTDFSALTLEKCLPVIRRICDKRQIPIPDKFKIVALERHLAFLVEELTNSYIHPRDFDSLVREAVHRLGLGMEPVISFLCNKVKDYPQLLAHEFGITAPYELENANPIEFTDLSCDTRQHRLTAPTMNDIGQCFVNDDLALHLLRTELAGSKFISIMHHEPPKTLPNAGKCDLISIRTRNRGFHISPITDPGESHDAIGILRSFDGIVYAWCPQGLYNILLRNYGWNANFYDITPHLENHIHRNLQEERKATLTDVSYILFNCAPCWRGRTFSWHKRPSRPAMRHREIILSLIYVLGEREIKAHEQSAGADIQEAGEDWGEEAEERRRHLEEEERRRQEEESRRQEEERQRQEVDDRLFQESEKLREETRRLERRREEIERDRLRNSLRGHRDRSPARRTSDSSDRPSDSSGRQRSPDHRRRSDAYEPAEDITRRRRH